LLGLLVKNVLGFCYILGAFLWLLGLLIFIENLFDCKVNRVNMVDITFKTLYLVLTLLILNSKYKSFLSLISIGAYILLLVIDIIVLNFPYRLLDGDKEKHKTAAKKAQSVINLLVDKNAILGEGKKQCYIKSLALVTCSTVAVIIFSILSIMLGKIYSYGAPLIVRLFVVTMCLTLFTLVFNITKYLDNSRACKRTIQLFALIAPAVFSFPPALVNNIVILRDSGVDIYMYIIGIGFSSSLQLFCIKSARWFTQKITDLDGEG